jgi:hypothetical protein
MMACPCREGNHRTLACYLQTIPRNGTSPLPGLAVFPVNPDRADRGSPNVNEDNSLDRRLS